VSTGRYPLAALVTQRLALRDAARQSVAEALRLVAEREHALAAAESARAELARELGELAAHLYDADDSGLLQVALVERRSAELHNVEERQRQAEGVAEASRAAVAAAEAELARRREHLVETDRDLQLAEKHQEAWRAERRRERARKDERQGEEVTLARFVAEAGEDEGAGPGRTR
jgi:hypothetical protein